MDDHIWGWASLIPPVLAIVLAVVTRRVLTSLFLGVLVGAAMLAWRECFPDNGETVLAAGNVWDWIVLTANYVAERFLWPTLKDEWNLRVLLFVVLMGAMVGLIHRCGGMHGVVNLLAPFAKSRRSGQMMTWVLGMFVFFDDYANTLLLGHTMRPVTDRLKICREKLAYLVDSTAAPVAGLAIISTWVATLISNVQDGFDEIQDSMPPETIIDSFWIVVQTIPYRFYVIFAILFVPMVAWMGRDFGPMLRAERRRLQADGGSSSRHVQHPVDDFDISDIKPEKRRWYNAALPVGTMVGLLVLLLITTGQAAIRSEGSEWTLYNVFGKADSYLALVYASLASLIVAVLLVRGQRLLSSPQVYSAAVEGIKKVIPACGILVLAWTLKLVTDKDALGTGAFLGALLTIQQQPDWMSSWWFDVYQTMTAIEWMPTAVFLLASFVAFATGTSWGTMGILTPIVIEVIFRLAVNEYGQCPPNHPIMLASIGGVLAGSIFGDHCSPISDTTVLSSQASSCDHVAHVRTQLPYAMVVGVISVICGTLPVGWGIPFWIVLPIGIALMLAFLRVFGKRVDDLENSTETPVRW